MQLGRLLELIAERQTFGSNQSIIDRDAGSLNSTFVEYIDGVRLAFETDIDKDITSPTQDIKLNYCNFITKLIKSFKLDSRPTLLSKELRRNLFYLFAHWTGKYANCILGNKRQMLFVNDDYTINDFELAALQAMSAVLCCGPCFDSHTLAEDSYIYYWIESLISAKDQRLNDLGQETIVFLLENNPDAGVMLDWLVDCCYTKSVKVADICFASIATIFCLREYPCDHYVSIIIVALMHVNAPRTAIHQLALQLLQQLDYRFFDTKTNSVLTLHVDDTDSEGESKTCDFSDSSDEQQTSIQLRNKSDHGTVKAFQPLLVNMMPCNQLLLSKRMAQLHPQLTMPIFSEITFRLQTARPAVCKSLLECVVPWLYNMELVDHHVPPQNNPISAPFNPLSSNADDLPRETEGESSRLIVSVANAWFVVGWGSSEATEMVLNNLMYITVKFSDEYLKEIEDVWAALSSCWPNNLRIIIRYLFIITGIAPNELLPYTKRVALFMAQSKPDRFIDEIMTELQSVESLNCLIERTETPPFYRITSVRKGSGHSDDECTAVMTTNTDSGLPTVVNVEQGTLHTKRHSTESGEKSNSDGTMVAVANAGAFLKENRTISLHDDVTRPLSSASMEEEADNVHLGVSMPPEICTKPQTPQPHPLPMPEFGGYYAQLTEYLPSSDQPIFCFHRCYLALMLLCDVLPYGIGLDWSPHIPTMLHISFLGLDHSRSVVNEHCKQLLIHLLSLCTRHKDDVTVSRILLQNKCSQLGYGLSSMRLPGATPNFTEPPNFAGVTANCCSRQSSLGRDRNILPLLMPCNDDKANDDKADEDSSTEVDSQKPAMTTEVLIKYLIDFMSKKRGSSLWNCEDITAKVWTIKSADQIAYFLEHILHVFSDAFPSGHIEERWAEISLQLALSCSSRHYAGRSLQIFRALKMPINSRMLSDILSRLVETVAEQGEDMQGYVTELMLTLESAVECLDSDQRAISKFIRDLFKSTPNLDNTTTAVRKSAPVPIQNAKQPEFDGPSSLPEKSSVLSNRQHNRSTSYTAAFGRKGHEGGALREIRNRSSTDSDMKANLGTVTNFGRSRSVQSLKVLEDLTPEDRTSLLAQFFWISMAMLETGE